MNDLAHTHDLTLPAWGPYTKKYIGISHIADAERGLRFDLSVFPGFYRRKVDVPNVMWESGFHPWEADADFTHIKFRHQLEWKDRVYTDISYAGRSEQSRRIRCHCVNHTSETHNIVLHLMASLEFPQVSGHGEILQEVKPIYPEGILWKDALDYEDLIFAKPRPTDHLVYDGWLRGEIRGQGFVNGSALGQGFGCDAEDRVIYRLNIGEVIDDGTMALRYRMNQDNQTSFTLLLSSAHSELTIPIQCVGAGTQSLQLIPVGQMQAGEWTMTLRAEGGADIELDGFAIGDADLIEQLDFVQLTNDPVPHIMEGPVKRSLILKYDACEQYYGIAWDDEQYEVREWHTSELDRFMRHHVHEHVQRTLVGDSKGHYTNVFLRPIVLPPHSERMIDGLICVGSLQEVEEILAKHNPNNSASEAGGFELDSLVPKTYEHCSPAGQPYVFGQQLLAVTLLMNVVYPVYMKGGYIRHHTPGRWWDSLYTWDSGFIGLGLLELDVQRAISCLNAYVTEPGDQQTAFIHHGSMVPVQHYLFLELWNRTQSTELLTYFYPRLKQYYEFFAGHAKGSTTRVLHSNLLKTWDYFYNSGGWDDYPAQVAVHRGQLQASVTPMISTSHAIRIASILRMAAVALGLDDDIIAYDADIHMFTTAIEQHGWDEETGYYGYVIHDEQGNPQSLLRDEQGVNYNMGFDGVYPLLSGHISKPRATQLLSHLTNPARIWSQIGLTAVDQSAPYYSNDGYWNGTIWMSHQWFFWKTMLDYGQTAAAWKIATTALKLWKQETERTYHSFEHFQIETGRGCGWHQFGGLSSPVLNWFASYYRPGTVSTGYDVWITEKVMADDASDLNMTLMYSGQQMASVAEHFTMIVCMKPGHAYSVTCQGRRLEYHERMEGLLEIEIPRGWDTYELTIKQA